MDRQVQARQAEIVDKIMHRDRAMARIRCRARRRGAARQDEIARLKRGIGHPVDDDEVAIAQVDRGRAAIFDHHRLDLREAAEAEIAQVDLVGAREEIADHIAAGAMIDRVTDAMGRLGPVGDADTMAANILEVWGGDHEAMRQAARAHALQFSWERSMEALFGRVYPAAFARQEQRQLRVTGSPALAA